MKSSKYRLNAHEYFALQNLFKGLAKHIEDEGGCSEAEREE